MSNFLRKFSKEKKDYKRLYEIELNNRKVRETQLDDLQKRYIDLQKEKGIDKLRLELMKISDELEQAKNELAFVKEDRSKLYIKLEDLRNKNKLEKKKSTTKKKKESKNGE